MNCPNSHEQKVEVLFAYVAGMLDGPAARDWERHVDSCPACAKALADHRALWSSLDEWTVPEVSPDFDARLFARIEAHDRQLEQSWWWRLTAPLRQVHFRPAFSLAAASLMIAALFLVQRPQATVVPDARPALKQKVDIEQVETSLEDMEMLNQVGVLESSD